jgi:PhoH-like ATPase
MPGRARRLFVLDTSVLLHDPAALYRFQEHDLYLPLRVLEELDLAQIEASERGANARQVSRFVEGLLGPADGAALAAGIPLPGYPQGGGRLFLETAQEPHSAPTAGQHDPILATALAVRAARPGREIRLVSRDINRRIRARMLGLLAEDYLREKVLDDIGLLYAGIAPLPAGAALTREEAGNGPRYRLAGQGASEFQINQGLYGEEGEEYLVRAREGDTALLERLPDYRSSRHAVWGVTARNREQAFALHLLLDPEIDFVTLLGPAGTGKTLLALAAGLAQVLETKRYREIVVTRATVGIAEDIGFLPGTEEEKMTPWMGALLDNLEVLGEPAVGGDWGRAASADLLRSRIKIRSLQFMRGRTFLSRYLLVDEAQNLSAKQMKALITRAGPGSKVVCLGNVEQIDTPFLTGTTSGLTYVVERFRGWPHGGHAILRRGERSRLADHANTSL